MKYNEMSYQQKKALNEFVEKVDFEKLRHFDWSFSDCESWDWIKGEIVRVPKVLVAISYALIPKRELAKLINSTSETVDKDK